MLRRPYLSQRALEGLRSYAYKPSGYSFLDKLHTPVWNYITNNWLPMWLAPNLITLMGLTALLAAYVAAWVELPEIGGFAPLWLYFFSGGAVFFYLHMDCLDGKQARRTRNSSPLGQLFDHGCDALAVHLVLANVACSLNFPPGWRLITSTFCITAPWILAHWEEYHTGIMVYGNGSIGVTEANYSVVLLHLVTGLIRPQSWMLCPLATLARSDLAHSMLPPLAIKFLAAVRLGEMFTFIICYSALSLGYQQVTRVFRLSGTRQLERTTLPKKEQGSKQLGTGHAAAHLAQLACFFLLTGVLLSMSADAAPGQGRVALLTFGITYSLQATRLIMAHMSKEPFEVAGWALVAIALQIANQYVLWLDPVLVSYSVCAVVIVGYLHYVVCVINEICAFLQIPCLSVKKMPAE